MRRTTCHVHRRLRNGRRNSPSAAPCSANPATSRASASRSRLSGRRKRAHNHPTMNNGPQSAAGLTAHNAQCRHRRSTDVSFAQRKPAASASSNHLPALATCGSAKATRTTEARWGLGFEPSAAGSAPRPPSGYSYHAAPAYSASSSSAAGRMGTSAYAGSRAQFAIRRVLTMPPAGATDLRPT